MSYTDLSALQDRFGTRMLVNLTDRATPQTGEIDTEIVDRAIQDAVATIDGHLLGRYVLPLSEVPALVATIAATLTIYGLHIYTPDEKIDADYKQALKSLKDIANGTIKLSVAGVPSKANQGSGARVTDRKRPMTAANLKGYI